MPHSNLPVVSLMIRIEFTVEDIARVSFLPEPAPMLELKLALISLRRRDPAPRLCQWRQAALAGFPASAKPLWDLVGGFSGALSTTRRAAISTWRWTRRSA